MRLAGFQSFRLLPGDRKIEKRLGAEHQCEEHKMQKCLPISSLRFGVNMWSVNVEFRL